MFSKVVRQTSQCCSTTHITESATFSHSARAHSQPLHILPFIWLIKELYNIIHRLRLWSFEFGTVHNQNAVVCTDECMSLSGTLGRWTAENMRIRLYHMDDLCFVEKSISRLILVWHDSSRNFSLLMLYAANLASYQRICRYFFRFLVRFFVRHSPFPFSETC